MSNSKPTFLVKLLVSWGTFLLIFSWLPLVRCTFDGDTYQWGTSHFGFPFSSAGLGPDLWLPAVKTIIIVYLLWGLLRGSNPVHRAGLVLWNVLWPVDGVLDYLRDPDGMMFHGDTLGIHLNLGLIIPVVSAVFAVLTISWAVRDSKSSDPTPAPPWTARNRRLLIAALLLLPLQLVLFRFGEPHGTTDAIGVLLTIAQCPLMAAAFYPSRS